MALVLVVHAKVDRFMHRRGGHDMDPVLGQALPDDVVRVVGRAQVGAIRDAGDGDGIAELDHPHVRLDDRLGQAGNGRHDQRQAGNGGEGAGQMSHVNDLLIPRGYAWPVPDRRRAGPRPRRPGCIGVTEGTDARFKFDDLLIGPGRHVLDQLGEGRVQSRHRLSAQSLRDRGQHRFEVAAQEVPLRPARGRRVAPVLQRLRLEMAEHGHELHHAGQVVGLVIAALVRHGGLQAEMPVEGGKVEHEHRPGEPGQKHFVFTGQQRRDRLAPVAMQEGRDIAGLEGGEIGADRAFRPGPPGDLAPRLAEGRVEGAGCERLVELRHRVGEGQGGEAPERFLRPGPARRVPHRQPFRNGDRHRSAQLEHFGVAIADQRVHQLAFLARGLFRPLGLERVQRGPDPVTEKAFEVVQRHPRLGGGSAVLVDLRRRQRRNVEHVRRVPYSGCSGRATLYFSTRVWIGPSSSSR